MNLLKKFKEFREKINFSAFTILAQKHKGHDFSVYCIDRPSVVCRYCDLEIDDIKCMIENPWSPKSVESFTRKDVIKKVETLPVCNGR